MTLRQRATSSGFLIGVIVVVAWILRVGFVVWLQARLDASHQKFLIAGDAEGYWDLARSIVEGRDYAIHYPPRYVHRMPGFPSILAVSIWCFGESLFAARLLLATLGALSCWLVYRLGTLVHSSRAGLLAAALAAVSPASIAFSGILLSETVFGLAMLVALICFTRLTQSIEACGQTVSQSSRPRTMTCGWALLTGAAISLGVYMKPSWILAGPICFILILLKESPRWRSALLGSLIMLGMIVPLVPWGLRNAQVSGHFKLTTFWMGPSLYDGWNPDATGDSDMRFFDEDQLPLTMTEYQVDKEYQRRAWDFARENPMRVINLAFVKAWRYWKPWPNAEQFQRWPIQLVLCLYTLPLYVFAVVGVWAVPKRFWPLAICAGPIFYFAGLHLIFVSSLRYRLPAEAPLLVLSAVGVMFIVSKETRAE